jgi:phosphoenolpyruvate-protein phosphotransferase
MISLSISDIRLGAAPASRTDAIREAAALLAEAGAIDPAYVESMLERERVATTYLGNGVAIPHGLPKDAGAIRETRVAVLQVPEGVEWDDGKRAYLLFAIAAKSDEHIGLLTRLTGLIEDAERVERLARSVDAGEIVRALESDGDAPVPLSRAARDFEGEEVVVLFENPRGFHLRPATQFAQVAKSFDGEVALVVGDRQADAKSPMSILKLGIAKGDRVRVRASGPGAARALDRLLDELEEIQHEPEEAAPSPPHPDESVHWEPGAAHAGATLTGTLAAPGLAFGPIWHWPADRSSAPSREAGDAESERDALRAAIAAARDRLHRLAESTDQPLNQIQRALFNAHAELVADDTLRGDAEAAIAEGRSAVEAWESAIEQRAGAIETLKDENLSKRAIDLRDVGRRVVRALLGVDEQPLAGVTEPVILVAYDLEPSEAAQLRPEKVIGICLAGGSPNAHSAIVSRSLGIPMLVAMGDGLASVPAGTAAILDASGARMLLDPSEEDVASVRTAVAALEAKREKAWATRFRPAMLRDGHRVEVVANIGKVEEAARAVEAGAEGVGLLRTEFLYLDRSSAPSEEEQYEALRQMLEALGGLPMIVRTMDIGGDKPVDYLGLDERDLSFLGLRGFRLSAARPELARTQLRAIFRAAAHGPLRLMFPMIATPDDFLEARAMAEEVRREVGAEPVEVGLMIEVPSAVTMAGELAELADFFSIGTNDLTQYALAVDRTHPLLASRVDSLHPAVLRMIDETVRAAHGAGKWVGVCGGLAGDIRGALILAGLGVDELSMPPALVAQVKEALRATDLPALQRLARRALRQQDARSVRALPLPM